MDSILNSSVEPDYYKLLGCDELSTVEQILAEYKVRALECHPDKQPGNQKAVEDFQKLQLAKETLANEESRAQYDYWRRSRIMIPFPQWEALQDSVKTSMHWAVQNKKEPMLDAPSHDSSNDSKNTATKCEEKSEITAISDNDILGKMPEDNLLSPKSPEGTSDSTYCLLRFRWSAEAPSDLLRKFRNYEI
ncbi:dnaJ homolog subfamily C member 12 [Rhinophrynus dorsalis]